MKVEETTLSIHDLLFDWPETADGSDLVSFDLTQPFDPMFSSMFEEPFDTDESDTHMPDETQYQQTETTFTSTTAETIKPANTNKKPNETNIRDKKQWTPTSQANSIQPSTSTVETSEKVPEERADSDLEEEDLDKIQSDVKPKSTVHSEIWATNRFHGNTCFKFADIN